MMKDPKLWPEFIKLFPEIVATTPPFNNITNYILQNLEVDVPNILLHSPVGFPLNLLWNHIATKKFGVFTKKECVFEKAAVYFETTYFFEIDFLHPSNTKVLDVLNDLIKTIISTSCICNDRHIIVCHNIEHIHDIYTFRVLLERYSKNALFVCTTHGLSNIESPLRSRFMSIRVPLFTHSDISNITNMLCPKHDIPPTRNIYKAIAALAYQGEGVEYNFPPIKDFFAKRGKATVLQVREFSNKVYAANVPFPLVVQDLLRHLPETCKANVVAKAAHIQHMMAQTNAGRQPIYYEWLIMSAFFPALC
jgi:hypothetical protein